MHDVPLLRAEVPRELDARVVRHLVVHVERVDDRRQVGVVEARLAVLGDVGREDLHLVPRLAHVVNVLPEADRDAVRLRRHVIRDD